MSQESIQIWLGNALPMWIKLVLDIAKTESPRDENGAAITRMGVVVFVAHVPSAVAANAVYQRGNWEGELSGWMRAGDIGLFGANALNVVAHPEGDGYLVVGCST